MIYLIKTSMLAVNDENDMDKDEVIPVLKIGYSEDSRGNGRFNDYTSNGLVIRVIKTIPGGSYLLENRLHRYFKDYRIPSRSREWFYCEYEIRKVFDEAESDLDLYKLFGATCDQDLILQEEDRRSDLYRFNRELQRNIEKFESDFPGDQKSEIHDLLLRFRDTVQFTDRMKLVCNNDLVEEDFQIFLQYTPERVRIYYNTLGPVRIKELSYRNDLLRKDVGILENNYSINVRDAIINAFKVGERYSLFDIKQTLRKIYAEIGYKRTSKAIDLETVFDVKRVSIFIDNGEGEKVKFNGYEILGIKF